MRFGLAGSLVGFLTASAVAGAAADNQTRAIDVLERTRTTQATYVVYTKDYVTIPGEEPFEGWSAEFHSGDLHRVDSSAARLIANCRERTGWGIQLKTGERFEGSRVANAACGINSNFELASAEWLGVIETPFGVADRVRVTDEHNVRTYDVLKNGAILRAVYAAKDGSQNVQVRQETLAVSDEVANLRVFDPATLDQSFVPDKYKGSARD